VIKPRPRDRVAHPRPTHLPPRALGILQNCSQNIGNDLGFCEMDEHYSKMTDMIWRMADKVIK
jgi:hypothetical protein